jgi:hypothetical protein
MRRIEQAEVFFILERGWKIMDIEGLRKILQRIMEISGNLFVIADKEMIQCIAGRM